MADPPAVDFRAQWRRNLLVLLFARTCLNLQFRVVCPFLRAISRGLGVPLESASLLVIVRSSSPRPASSTGSLRGPRFWASHGLSDVAVTSAGMALAAGPLLWFTKEHRR